MKKKPRYTGAVVIAVLILLLFLIGPAAPLFERMGLKLFCIQGEFPRIQFVACPEETSVWDSIPLPASSVYTPSPNAAPVIVDDDGSIDGLIALLYFLSDPTFDVQAVTVSSGEAHPGIFSRDMLQFLARLGRADIPVGAGRETPLVGDNTFPEPWREHSDNFWGFSPPEKMASSEPVPAAELIVRVITESPQPVMVFISGTHTNLAEALRKQPGIAGNIASIHVMGGAVYTSGNIHSDWPSNDNTVSEWNIWVDPVAANEVFSAGIPLYLTPLDATNQVIWTEADVKNWASSGSNEGILAGKMLNWMISNWYPDGAYVWDLVAAANAGGADLCDEMPLALEVITKTGPSQGQTAVTDGKPNVLVCLEPNIEKMIAHTTAIFESED